MDLFTRFTVVKTEAGHHVLLRDGCPVAQGSMQTLRLSPYWRFV